MAVIMPPMSLFDGKPAFLSFNDLPVPNRRAKDYDYADSASSNDAIFILVFVLFLCVGLPLFMHFAMGVK